jgi:DNA-binding LytR/AlgR family response regulator
MTQIKLKVAILEDNKEQLKDRKMNLEENGLAKVVVWSTNSTDFIEKVSIEKPDALLLDIDLGNDSMTGLDVAYKLKLPVMFVSGHNAKNLKDIESLQREFDFPVEHITKPFTEKDFIKTATRFLKEVNEQLKSAFVYLDFKDTRKIKIAVHTIVYLESETGKSGASNNKRIYFTDRKPETLCDFSFTKMTELGFDSNLFVQPHKSFRLNINKHMGYNNNHTINVEVMNDLGKMEPKQIPVSENYQKPIRELMR